MSQSDGFNSLKRMAIKVTDLNGNEIAFYKFAINPEDYKEDYPQRTTIFKTRTSTVVEDYGTDLMKISFSGTTGFGKRKNGAPRGQERINNLKNLLKQYGESSYRLSETGGNLSNNNLLMYFYNFTDGGSYQVHLDPAGWSIERSAQRPTLYDYSINLIVLQDANKPKSSHTVAPVLGNDNKPDAIGEVSNPNSSSVRFYDAAGGIRPLMN